MNNLLGFFGGVILSAGILYLIYHSHPADLAGLAAVGIMLGSGFLGGSLSND